MRHHRSVRVPQRAPILLLLLALTLSLQVFSGLNSSVSQALAYQPATIVLGMTLPGGPGHTAPVKAVVWSNGGKKGFCIQFGLDWPNSAGTTMLAGDDRVPGMSETSSAKAKWIANKYATTKNRRTAAAAALAVWTLESNSRFDTWWAWATKNNKIDDALRSHVAAILNEAGRYATLKMTVTGTPVDYLETGTAKVSVRTEDGPLGGVQVTLKQAGVRILSASKQTGADGTVTVKYRRTTASGEVSFTASVEGLSTSRAGVSRSSWPHQMTLSGGYRDTRSARFAYTRTLDAPTITSTCGTDCNGTSAVSVKACNADAVSPVRYPILDAAGRTIATLDVPAGTCASKSVTAGDGGQVRINRYCHLSKAGAGCATPYVKVKEEQRVTIDCPAWASAEVTLGCNCSESWSRVSFKVPGGSPRHYEGTVTFGPSSALRPLTAKLKAGETTTLAVPRVLPAGTVLTAGFTIRDDAGKVTHSETLVKVEVLR